MTRHVILESLLLPLLLIAGTVCVRAQDRWDGILDRYAAICDRCIELRQRISAGEAVPDKSVTSLFQELGELRKTLQDASGAMNTDQKKRFQTIQQRYAAATGQTSETRQRPAPSRPAAPARTNAPDPGAPARDFGKPSMIRDSLFLPEIAFPLSGTALSLRPDESVQQFTAPSCRQPAITRNPGMDDTVGSIPAAPSWSLDVLALYGYGRASSFGLMAAAGIGPRWGVWLAGRSNFTATGSSYDCTSGGRAAGGRFWGNGNSRYGILSISGGPLWRPLSWLGVYAGAGYAREELDWQDAENQWACVRDYTYSGICWDAGLLFHWKHLSLSAGCGWSNHATITAGIGLHF
jgi:opacity protein-like surface antigen